MRQNLIISFPGEARFKVELGPMEIAGKHVLITGAAKRIGRAIGEAILARGGRVTGHYHQSGEEMARWLAETRERGGALQAVAADLRQPEAIRQAVTKAQEGFGPIDILINSASLFYPRTALDTTPEDWETFLSVNLTGQFYFVQACAPAMLAQQRGCIIQIADVTGTTGAKGFAPYASSKAALLLLTKSLAKEFAPAIRVNSVSPGPTLPPDHYSAEQKERAVTRTLLKRWGTPEDVVAAVLFLIGNDYITGFDLKVDGGRSLS